MMYFQTNNLLVPRQVFIGDRAEIRCSFSSDGGWNQDGRTGELTKDAFTSSINFTEYEILGIQLQRTGNSDFTLVVAFVPWRTGPIQLPDYDLVKAIGGTENQFGIHFEPVEIISLVERDSVSTLQGLETPLLLPGTAYKLYAALILGVVVLAFITSLMIRHKRVSAWLKKRRLFRQYKKNRRNTEKQLYALQKQEKLSAHDSAEQLQKILRGYLEARLSYPFTKTVSSELKDRLVQAAQGLGLAISDTKQAAFNSLSEIFKRTDFLRFSRSAEFQPEERQRLIGLCLEAIAGLELEEENNAEA